MAKKEKLVDTRIGETISDGHRGGEVRTHEPSSCKRWVDRIAVGIHKEATFRRYSRYLYEPLVLSEMESKILV